MEDLTFLKLRVRWSDLTQEFVSESQDLFNSFFGPFFISMYSRQIMQHYLNQNKLFFASRKKFFS